MFCDRLEDPVFHKKKEKLTEKSEKRNIFLLQYIDFFLILFITLRSSSALVAFASPKSDGMKTLIHHQTVCNCCYLKVWHSILRSESINQPETEQTDCIICGSSSEGFSCCFRKVVIPRCSDTGTHSLMLSTIKPPWMLNNTEPVYSELEGTLWCSGCQYCRGIRPLKSLQNNAITQISGVLCCLCSDRQRARAAVSQRLFSPR